MILTKILIFSELKDKLISAQHAQTKALKQCHADVMKRFLSLCLFFFFLSHFLSFDIKVPVHCTRYIYVPFYSFSSLYFTYYILPLFLRFCVSYAVKWDFIPFKNLIFYRWDKLIAESEARKKKLLAARDHFAELEKNLSAFAALASQFNGKDCAH